MEKEEEEKPEEEKGVAFCLAGDVCVICSEELVGQEEVASLPPCTHRFCFKCIYK